MLSKIARQLYSLIHKSKLERELDDELRFHLELETARNIRRGFSPEEAARLAHVSFGGTEQVKEQCREVRGTRRFEELWQDIRYGVRMFLKSPVFTLTAVITLALGIGANTAIFSVVQAVLIRPLPYHDAERIVWLSNRNETLGVKDAFLNPADILDFREQSRSFEYIAAWGTLPLNLYGAHTPERVEGVFVTPNFFRALGVQPVLGRDFSTENESDSSVIISYGLWQRQFGGEVNVIGRKFDVGLMANAPDAHPVVVGVLPPGADFPQRTDLFTVSEIYRSETDRGGSHNWRTIGRLKLGVTIDQAQAEISTLTRVQAQQYPDTNKGWDVEVVPFRQHLFGGAEIALPLLFGAVAFVLVIACANVANLQLGRAFSRRKEFALRLALGAGRWRVVRQLLIESLLLSLSGCAVGLLIAIGGLSVLRVVGPGSVPRLKTAALNPLALGFAVGLGLLSAVIFGLVPALHASHSELNVTLKDSHSLGTTPSRSNRFRQTLVVGQISLALVLLTGAGLVIKSFWRLQTVNPGFKSSQILTAGLSLSFADYPNGSPQRTLIFREAIERLSALPGVTSVAAISHLPFGGRTMQLPFNIKGQSRLSKINEAVADYRVVTPSFFETMGTSLKKGRNFDEHDKQRTPQVFIVNEAFVRTYLSGVEPVGAQLDGDSNLVKGEIVGVVEDVKHNGMEVAASPTFYVSYQQSSTFPIMNFLVRTQTDPASLSVAVQRELQALDARGIVFNVRPLNDFIADSVAPRRFNFWLFGAFAGLAVLLAAGGIYGTISYAVAQRTREIGIRVALGAQGSDVLKLVVGEGIKMIAAGMLIGFLASLALAGWMKTLLFAVSATDPATYISIGLLLSLVALTACWLPARRATKVDPLISLRYE